MEILGKKVKDKITKCEGIAIAKCTYLNGCIQYSIQREVTDSGEIPKEIWVDEQDIEITSKEKIIKDVVGNIIENRGGGARPHPPSYTPSYPPSLYR